VPGRGHEAVQRLVVPQRVVVKEIEPPDPRRASDLHDILPRAVAPARLGRVLLRRVLRVVDHEVSAGEEFNVPAVLAGDLAGACRRQQPRVGLVVRGVHDRDAVGLEPVAERERRVVQVAGRDLEVADREGALDEIVVADGGAELLERDGEVGVLHLSR